jgi:lantibiotic transport system ATP-binding protein
MATHVGIINKGKLLFQGTMDDLRGKQKERIKMEVESKGEVESYLKEIGVPFTSDNFFIYFNRDISPAKLNRDLILNGFAVHQLMKQKNSLEEIFLTMTAEEKMM